MAKTSKDNDRVREAADQIQATGETQHDLSNFSDEEFERLQRMLDDDGYNQDEHGPPRF